MLNDAILSAKDRQKSDVVDKTLSKFAFSTVKWNAANNFLHAGMKSNQTIVYQSK